MTNICYLLYLWIKCAIRIENTRSICFADDYPTVQNCLSILCDFYFKFQDKHKKHMVELSGIEPLTPCMPCKCSTIWAIAPYSHIYPIHFENENSCSKLHDLTQYNNCDFLFWNSSYLIFYIVITNHHRLEYLYQLRLNR